MYTPTKEIISKNLQKYLEANKMTQAELAEAINVNPSSVTQWIQEKTSPRAGMVDKICRVFRITKDEFMRNYDDPSSSALSKSIPLYSSMYAEKNPLSDSSIERYVAADLSVAADFAIHVASPSMADVGIDYGDIAFFCKNFKFVDGNIYAVWNVVTEAVGFKRIYTSGNNLILISEHNDFAPLVIDSSQVIIIGELIGVYKEIKQPETGKTLDDGQGFI